jgi:hypothetical protein
MTCAGGIGGRSVRKKYNFKQDLEAPQGEVGVSACATPY